MAPLLLVAGLTWQSWQLSTRGPAEAVWVEAGDAGPTADRRVELALVWSEPLGVMAPAWSGLVRQVSVVEGQALTSGDAVAQIDGVTRLAWHSPAPFYRPLALRDMGDDVASLNELLQHRGLAAGDGDVFSAQTRRGVRDLGRQLGVVDNYGVFDPALIVFLPAQEVLVTEVLIRAGTPAPAQGTAVFMTAPELRSVVLTAPGVPGQSAAADDGSVVTSLTAASDEVLVLGGVELPLAETRDRLGSEGITVVAGMATTDQISLVAKLRRELPGGSVRIPSAALHTAPDGTMCVVVGSAENPKTVRVSVVDGLAGETVVTGGLSARQQVGIGELAPGAQCG